jgi:hypothetical protein
MRIKDSSVRFVGIQPGILKAFARIEEVYQHFGEEAVITSLNDGNHMKGSFHYKGLAIDLRTRYFDYPTIEMVMIELKLKLGDEYDIIFETNHIHIEYDPKK